VDLGVALTVDNERPPAAGKQPRVHAHVTNQGPSTATGSTSPDLWSSGLGYQRMPCPKAASCGLRPLGLGDTDQWRLGDADPHLDQRSIGPADNSAPSPRSPSPRPAPPTMRPGPHPKRRRSGLYLTNRWTTPRRIRRDRHLSPGLDNYGPDVADAGVTCATCCRSGVSFAEAIAPGTVY